MDEKTPYKLKLSFPGSLEYVSPIRKFVSEVLLVNNYSQKFAYRTEVIVDEVCSNAINYGCKSVESQIDFTCLVYPDRMEIEIKDQGGNKKDIERLRVAVDNGDESQTEGVAAQNPCKGCLGLEIVRMLSSEMDMQVDENNMTTLRIVRKRKATKKLN